MAAWYAFRGGRAIGPFTRDEIAAAIAAADPSNHFELDDLFCPVDADDWRPARAIPELAVLFRPPEGLLRSKRAERSSDDATTGDLVTGDLVTGDLVTGDLVTGDLATGDLVTGDLVTGDLEHQIAGEPTSREPPTGPMTPLAPDRAPPAPYAGAALPGQASRSDLRATPAPPAPPEVPSCSVTGRSPTAMPAWVSGAITGVLLVTLLGVAVMLLFASDTSQPEPPGVSALQGALPPPYESARLGARREVVEARYPPSESTTTCHFRVFGAAPTALPSSVEGPASCCPTVQAVAGVTGVERRRVREEARRMAGDGEGAPRAADVEAGLLLALAQVRGAARAGALSDRQLMATFRYSGATLQESSFSVAVTLTRGALALALRRERRRDLAALVNSTCDDVEPARVEALVRGELAFAREGPRGLRRCRAFTRSQGLIAGRAVATSGALLLAGWVRSSGLDPDEAEGRAVRFLRREACLDEAHATFALRLAATREATEAFFEGAVMLASEEPSSIWGAALVWFSGDEVTRLMLNVRDDDALESLESFLAPTFGRPRTVSPTTVTWRGGGFEARLDRGASVALVLADD